MQPNQSAPNQTPTITYVVHGYNVSDGGKDTVAMIIPELNDVGVGQVINWKYGKFGLMDVIHKNKLVASDIVAARKADHAEDCYAVGHSNGCAILVEAARQGAKFKRLLLINPALKVDTNFPIGIDEILVVHTKHDVPTQVARVCNWIPLLGLIIPNAWGAMGRQGYKGKDRRVINLDLSNQLDAHSDVFEASTRKTLIRRLLSEALYSDELPKQLVKLCINRL